MSVCVYALKNNNNNNNKAIIIMIINISNNYDSDKIFTIMMNKAKTIEKQ